MTVGFLGLLISSPKCQGCPWPGRPEDPSLQEVKWSHLQNLKLIAEGHAFSACMHAEMIADEFASCGVALEQIYRFCDKF